LSNNQYPFPKQPPFANPHNIHAATNPTQPPTPLHSKPKIVLASFTH
jgi:hypothetical protein